MFNELIDFYKYYFLLLISSLGWALNFIASLLATLFATYAGVRWSLSHNRKEEHKRDCNRFIVVLRAMSLQIGNNIKALYPEIIYSIKNHEPIVVRFSNYLYKTFLQDPIAQKFVGIGITESTNIFQNEIDRINRLLDIHQPGDKIELILSELEEVYKQLKLHSKICASYLHKQVDWTKGGHGDLDRKVYRKILEEMKDKPIQYLKLDI